MFISFVNGKTHCFTNKDIYLTFYVVYSEEINFFKVFTVPYRTHLEQYRKPKIIISSFTVDKTALLKSVYIYLRYFLFLESTLLF